MRVTIPDDLFDHYQSLAAKSHVNVDSLVAMTLERCKAIDPADRVVILSAAERNALEGLLPGGSITTGAEIVSKVEALASLRIGNVKLDFSPGQMAELAWRAEKNGRSVQEETKRTVDSISGLFFDNLRGL